jgi:Copper transport outer membrane protein, MctB
VVSFRFHLVSLVAVFMALGLGVLTGTTVINRGIVANLENQTEEFRVEADRLRADVDRLAGQLDSWSAFGGEVMDTLVTGRLNGTRVIVVTQEGTDDASIDGVLRALDLASDETIVGPLTVTARMALAGEGDRAELASTLGLDLASEPEALQAEAAAQLADRLSVGATGTDILQALEEAGFLVDQGAELTEANLEEIGQPDQAVVVLAGGPAPSRLPPERFLVPLVNSLASDGVMVAAAEPANGPEDERPFVALIRSGQASAAAATQDNVDQIPGQIGLVLALEDLLGGEVGHYGVKDGAAGTIPEV